MAPIPELHYRALNLIVPATFGAVGEGGQVNFEKQTVILLDHFARPASPTPIDPAVTGRIFKLPLAAASARWFVITSPAASRTLRW